MWLSHPFLLSSYFFFLLQQELKAFMIWWVLTIQRNAERSYFCKLYKSIQLCKHLPRALKWACKSLGPESSSSVASRGLPLCFIPELLDPGILFSPLFLPCEKLLMYRHLPGTTKLLGDKQKDSEIRTLFLVSRLCTWLSLLPCPSHYSPRLAKRST